jgi:flagellar biogenesis protein FliO
MMLLQVDDQRILVAVNPQDIRTLHTWNGRDNTIVAGEGADLTQSERS